MGYFSGKTNYRTFLLRLESKLLQQKPIAFLLDKKSGPVIAIAGLKETYAKFRSAVLSFVLDKEIADNIGGEEIPDDHFSLAFAVSIAFLREGNIYPGVKVVG